MHVWTGTPAEAIAEYERQRSELDAAHPNMIGYGVSFLEAHNAPLTAAYRAAICRPPEANNTNVDP